MEHMNGKYPKGDAMLRPHKESTLEKQQASRRNRRKAIEERMNAHLKSEIDPTLDK